MAAPETLETASGPIEFERAGEGAPVLVIHGTPGGSDSSIAMGKFLVESGFEVIAPSRPGYLGTELGDRGEIDVQADMHAALLDALGYAKAGVLAWSGGGPSSYRFAVNHPDRITALVPFAAVSGKYEAPPEKLDEEFMLESSIGNWMLRYMAAHMPKGTIKATLKAEGDLDRHELKALVEETVKDPEQAHVVLTMANVVGDYKHRSAGVENDLAQFGEIESLGLEQVKAPTLVINGSADTDVPPDHSDFAAANVDGAKQIVMDRGTHLCLFAHADARAVQAEVVEFFRAAV